MLGHVPGRPRSAISEARELTVPAQERGLATGSSLDFCGRHVSNHIAEMERSAFGQRVPACQRLFPGCVGVQVPRQFHGVVQYPTDHNQGGLKAVNQEVARPADCLRTCTHGIPAQS
jgi:hypothetical protein